MCQPEKNIEIRVKEIKKYVKELFTDANRLNNPRLKTLSFFSIVDSFTQAYCCGKNNVEKFSNFLNNFSNSKQRKILNYYDPVTIYYAMENKPEMSELNLNYLMDGHEYSLDIVQKYKETKKIIKAASEEETKKETEKEKRKISKLIYKWRSKITHELSYPTVVFNSMHKQDNIFYYPLGMEEPVWQMVIPNKFLEKLFTTCINNYLDECLREGNDPFAKTLEYKHWYEK